MKHITLVAPAKINLCLDVTERRADGYHNIESIMQSVSLNDRVELYRSDEDSEDFIKRIAFGCNNTDIPCDEKNLAHRAALAFFDYCAIEKYDIQIEIHKNIPVSAGLAGGSTDAAATILALNELYETGLNVDTLCQIGATFGADVPFCIRRGIYRATGIGDELRAVPKMPPCSIVIAIDGYGVSTPWAYGELDRISIRLHPSAVKMERALTAGELGAVLSEMGNVFEEAVLPYHQKAADLKKRMQEYGADIALMSGSVPSIFGVFSNPKKAKAALRKLRRSGICAYLCRPYYPSLIDPA